MILESSLIEEASFEDEFIKQLYFLRSLFCFHKNVYVYFCNTINEMCAILECPLPEWVIGHNTKDHIYMVRKSGWAINTEYCYWRVILHEFIHICLENTCRTKLPLWLNEGIAVFLSDQLYDTEQICTDYSVPELDAMNYDSTDFYIIVGFFVKKLASSFGTSCFIKKIQECEKFDTYPYFYPTNTVLETKCSID